MGGIIGSLVDAILGSLVKGVVDAINAKRRDAALEELGYTKAARDAAVEALKGKSAADAIPRLGDDNVDRLLRDRAAAARGAGKAGA